MAKKLVRLADSDPLALKLKKGAVVQMGDGWRGKVESDDGDSVVLVRDGAEPMNEGFVGYRGFRRHRATTHAGTVMCRSAVVDLASKRVVRCRTVVVVDRARLESEWASAPGYDRP